MNIYIYGDKSFQADMSKILNEPQLKQRVAQFCDVIKLKSVDKLKEAILLDPTDIYLIDHNSIIVKNFFTTKIKILSKKDGIDEEFLKEHGVGDMSVDDLSELSKYILKRLKSLEVPSETDEQDEILKELASMDEDFFDEIEEIDGKIVDNTLETKEVEEVEEIEEEIGDKMDELTQLDDINEADLREALLGIDDIDIGASSNASKVIEVEPSQMDSVAHLLEELMNNKTLEISIKVKS